MMKRILLSGIVSAVVGLVAVQADTYTAPFPSDSSTVISSVGVISPGEYGYFWSVSRGDLIEESFGGTGLSLAYGLDLEFDVTQNVLATGAQVDWDVLINGTDVGDWTWGTSDGIGHVSLSYGFSPVWAGAGSTFDVALVVKNEVASGDGSIAISYDGPDSNYKTSMTLTGRGGAQVPDAGGMMSLLGVALAGMFWAKRRWVA